MSASSTPAHFTWHMSHGTEGFSISRSENFWPSTIASEDREDTLSPAEIDALTDDELVQFIKARRRPDDSFILPISLWKHADDDGADDEDDDDEDTTHHIFNRLKERFEVCVTKANALHQSYPVPLDEVDARLLPISKPEDSDRSPSPPPRDRRFHSPTPPPIPRSVTASWNYGDLVREGGRPAYHFGLFDNVILDEDARSTRDVLEGWKRDTHFRAEDPDSGEVFREQVKRWRLFRYWQKDNRGEPDTEAGWEKFLADEKVYYERDRAGDWLATFEEDRPRLREDWEDIVYKRQVDMRNLRRDRSAGAGGCSGAVGFAAYSEKVKNRLVAHGVSRPLELDEDASKQDVLTTWLEYLGFECAWLDYYHYWGDPLEAKYAAAKPKLVESGCIAAWEWREAGENDVQFVSRISIRQAEGAVESCRDNVKRVCDRMQSERSRLRIRPERRAEMIEVAQERLQAAIEMLDVKKEAVKAAEAYEPAQRELRRQEARVRWIRSQVPLVEAEMTAGSEVVADLPSARRQPSEKREFSVGDGSSDDEETTMHEQKRLRRTHSSTPTLDDDEEQDGGA